MQRVAVVGSGGAGKTTFSERLGALVGLPVVHLDRHFWRPGWEASEREEWRRSQAELLAGESWIADGNYSSTLDLRLERADTVIVLGASRWRCLWRVVRRSLAHRGQELQAPGCPERLDREFLRYVWRYPTDARPRLDAAIARHRAALTVVELSTPRAVEAYLVELAR